MKKFLVLFLLEFLVSCDPAGTVKTGFDDKEFHYCVVGKDTMDLFFVYPSKGSGIYVAKFRNNTTPTALEYPVGKTHETVIILDHANDWLVKKQTVINGRVISENDSIVVIKKNKP